MTFKDFRFKAHTFALLCILLGLCEYRHRIFVSFPICSVHTLAILLIISCACLSHKGTQG